MKIRAYREEDLEALRAIHAGQGFGYAFPELGNPLFLTKLVLVEENENNEKKSREAEREERGRKEKGGEGEEGFPSCGHGAQPCCAPTRRVVGAAFLRLTAEAYLLLDPGVGSPRERWEWLLGLHEATRREAWAQGLEDVHAWLPPEIAERFGKRLKRLGWVRDDAWTPYCKRLSGGGE